MAINMQYFVLVQLLQIFHIIYRSIAGWQMCIKLCHGINNTLTHTLFKKRY